MKKLTKFQQKQATRLWEQSRARAQEKQAEREPEIIEQDPAKEKAQAAAKTTGKSKRRLPAPENVSADELQRQYLEKLSEWRQSLNTLPDYMRDWFEPIHHAYLQAPDFDSAPLVGTNITTWNWVFWSVVSYPQVFDALLYLHVLPQLMPAPEVVDALIKDPDIDFAEKDVRRVAEMFLENLGTCMRAARKDFLYSLRKRLNTVIQEVADEVTVKVLKDVESQLHPIAPNYRRDLLEKQEDFFLRLRKDRVGAPRA